MSHTVRFTPLVALAALVAGALVLVPAPVARAQGAPTPRDAWEMLASSGALVPTGAERTVLKDAPLSTLAVSYVSQSRVAVTTTIGWARARDRVSGGDPKLDVFTYDVGAEARAPRRQTGASAAFAPFIGVGVGGRSYRYRRLDVGATHNLAGYGAAGGELGRGRVHLRFELRDYVTAFKPLTNRHSPGTRNDVAAVVGLRIARRAP